MTCERQSHDIDPWMHWCARCGRPRTEIVEHRIDHCDGLKGVTHARYIEARTRADLLFNPILDAVMQRVIEER